jgi:mRNA deadenylase 3'-5' endonuclease subunit Ccr4
MRRLDEGMTSLSITVMTLNLHEGQQPSESPNSWEKRRDICVSVITSYSPTILCTQQGERGDAHHAVSKASELELSCLDASRC